MNKTLRFRGGRRRKSKASRRIKHVKRTARRTGRRIGRRIGRRTKHRNSKRRNKSRNKSRKRHMGGMLGLGATVKMPDIDDLITLTEENENGKTVQRLGEVKRIRRPDWPWNNTIYFIEFNDGGDVRGMELHNKQFAIIKKEEEDSAVVADLKKQLEELGLDITGTKAELEERLKEAWDAEGLEVATQKANAYLKEMESRSKFKSDRWGF